MKIKQFISNRAVRAILAAALAILIMAPTSALAETAAGTVITNTATVTWAGNATGVSDSATVTVTTLAAAPALVYTSTDPPAAALAGQGVGSSTSVDVVYTATSSANGVDTYDLTWLSTLNTDVSAPTYAVTNPADVVLGGSMILSVSGAVVTIPGGIADHGLEATDTIIISGTPYTISSTAANGTDTDITLNVAPAVTAAGTPIFEQKQVTLTLTTGTLSAATGTHAMALTGTSQLDAGQTTTVSDPTIYVAGATLGITKTALTPGGTQPGDTITYQIVVDNSGTANAANVVITDPIPNFTDFNGGVVNGGCTVTYSNTATPPYAYTYTPVGPPDPAVTAIRFDCGNLASAGTLTVGFDAVIE